MSCHNCLSRKRKNIFFLFLYLVPQWSLVLPHQQVQHHLLHSLVTRSQHANALLRIFMFLETPELAGLAANPMSRSPWGMMSINGVSSRLLILMLPALPTFKPWTYTRNIQLQRESWEWAMQIYVQMQWRHPSGWMTHRVIHAFNQVPPPGILRVFSLHPKIVSAFAYSQKRSVEFLPIGTLISHSERPPVFFRAIFIVNQILQSIYFLS